MMGQGVMFRKIVRQIGGARSPIYMELFLFDAVLYPVEPHVYRFGFALADMVVGQTVCCGIVNLYVCGWPISPSVILRGTPSLVLLKRAPHSASAAEDMMLHMLVDVTRRGPFPMSGFGEAMSPR